MSGGPDPTLFLNGDRADILAECQSYIEAVGGQGGYILTTGGGAAVGSPPEKLAAMVEASQRAADALCGA